MNPITTFGRRQNRTVATAMLMLAAGSAAYSQTIPAPPEYRPTRDHILDAVAKGRSPAVSVAVVKDGRVIWAEGFGIADRERNIPATADTIYSLASISKPLTATGLMVLAERGLIDLDAPANRYLPGEKLRAMVGSADGITIRRLANHTAGLPVHNNFFFTGTKPPSMEETIRRYGFAAVEPGSAYGYSNLAFGILEYIVATVSKMPWREFQEKTIYDPLGMRRTSDRIRPGYERDASVRYAHDVGGRYVRVDDYDFDHRGASAIWSSANDLARFIRMHLNDGALDGVRVLKPESAREMRRMTGVRGPGVGKGVAWDVGPMFGHDSFTHNGGMPGVATVLNAYPGVRGATIVLTNSDDRPLPVEISRRLAQALHGEPATEPPAPSAAGQEPRPAPPAGSALVGAWTGTLADVDGNIQVRLSIAADGSATASFNGRPAMRLTNVTMTEKTFSGTGKGILFAQPGLHAIPDLNFTLTRKDDRLTGVCSAFLQSFFTLPHFVSLTREAPGSEPGMR